LDVFWLQNASKTVFGHGSTPDPAGELTTLPSIVGWRTDGTPLLIPLPLDAFGASVLAYHF